MASNVRFVRALVKRFEYHIRISSEIDVKSTRGKEEFEQWRIENDLWIYFISILIQYRIINSFIFVRADLVLDSLRCVDEIDGEFRLEVPFRSRDNVINN